MRHILGLGIKVAALCIGLLYSGVSAAETVNYDTAWTFVYDGGTYIDGGTTYTISDEFSDIKSLPDGSTICVGSTRDSIGYGKVLMMKLNPEGVVAWKRLYLGGDGNSVVITKNNNFVVGGDRIGCPWIFCTDTSGVIKWSNWVYDSIKDQYKFLSRAATINCVRETSRGTFICAAGDEYPNNGGMGLKDYDAVLIFDSTGNLLNWGEGGGQPGFLTGGFWIEEGDNGNLFQAGNQAVTYIDTSLHPIWEKKYTIALEGVGTVTNNVMRCKKLRNGTIMVAGQAYEGNCWLNYKSLYYDAWWAPISYAYGTNLSWDTAGVQGSTDIIYDFTQLVDGRLAFTGLSKGGVWAFVTDSTGKQVLWQGASILPGVDSNNRPLTSLLPLSICATPDSGFTIVGDNNTYGNNHNAFAMHWAPKPPLGIHNQQSTRQSTNCGHASVVGVNVLFTMNDKTPIQQITIFNAAGKVVACLNGSADATRDRIMWKRPSINSGVYLYRIIVEKNVFTGMVVVP